MTTSPAPVATNEMHWPNTPDTSPAPPRKPEPQRAPADDRTGALWRAKFILLALTILSAGAAFGVSKLLPRTYESTATVRITVVPSGSGSQDAILASNDLANQYAQLVATGPVLTAAARQLGLTSLNGISGGVAGAQNLVVVRADARSAASTQRRADATAAAFVDFVQATNRTAIAAALRPLNVQLAAVNRQINAVRQSVLAAPPSQVNAQTAFLTALLTQQQRIQSQIATIQTDAPTVQIVDPASNGVIIEPRPYLYSAIAAIAGFIVCAQIVVLVADRRARRAAADW